MEPILFETVDYEKEERRKKRKRYWIIAISTFVTIVLFAYAFWLLPLLFMGDNSPVSSWQDKNIPLYSNEIFQTRTNYTVNDTKTNKPSFYFEKRIYLSDDNEQKVKSFFYQQLPAAGWTVSQVEPPNGLNPSTASIGVRATLNRGKNETLLLELGIVGQRTQITFTYQETLS